jgi:orotate phosphoribosyltransferase
VTDFYVELIGKEVGHFDRVAGIPTAGMPFSSVVAFKLGKPFLYVRREPKRYGREREIEGMLTPGDKVLLLDDLVTTGGTLLKAARALRAEGALVREAVVLIDREEGWETPLKKADIKLHCLLKMSEASRILYEIGVIDEEQQNLILKQIERRK